MSEPSAENIIKELDLAPHPEGGWFAETFRDPASHGVRAHSTAIYYLLKEGEASAWHLIDAAEVWHYYAGAPLDLALASGSGAPERHLLGADLAAGERPQIVVPAGYWQTAASLGKWTLVGCTVAPAFDFAGFRLADETESAALDAALAR